MENYEHSLCEKCYDREYKRHYINKTDFKKETCRVLSKELCLDTRHGEANQTMIMKWGKQRIVDVINTYPYLQSEDMFYIISKVFEIYDDDL